MERVRYTEKRYPIAAALLRNDIAPLRLVDHAIKENYNYERLTNIISSIAPMIGSVDIVTAPFMQAIEAAKKSLINDEALAHVPGFHSFNSIILNGTYTIYEAYNKDGLLYCCACQFVEVICTGYGIIKIDTKTGEANTDLGNFQECQAVGNVAAICLIYDLFKQFAETEIKILPVGKKQELFRCLYLNDLPKNVNLITCNWFTELHHNNPFFVRGHWRFQPYGEGRQQRRLIWIDLYKKGGYHSQAGKDKNKE